MKLTKSAVAICAAVALAGAAAAGCGSFFGRGGAEWGPIMAASTMYTIPVVIFLLIIRRRLVGGLVAGAVTG